MNATRLKGLGRGLDILLDPESDTRQDQRQGMLAVTALRPGKYQP